MHLPDPDSMFVNPQGKWNNSRIVFDNGHVEHYLNGHKIWNSRHGPTIGFNAKKAVNGKCLLNMVWGAREFCLQDHGYPASFRNIKIKELSKKIPAKTEFCLTEGLERLESVRNRIVVCG